MLAVRKKDVVTGSLPRIFGAKLMEPGSCLGVGGLSRMIEFITDTLLRVLLEERLPSGVQV